MLLCRVLKAFLLYQIFAIPYAAFLLYQNHVAKGYQLNHVAPPISMLVLKALFFIEIVLKFSYSCKKMQNFWALGAPPPDLHASGDRGLRPKNPKHSPPPPPPHCEFLAPRLSVTILFITIQHPYYIFLWIQCTKSSMKLVWKYGRLSSIPFLKYSIPFWHLPYSIPKFPFHFIPYHSLFAA